MIQPGGANEHLIYWLPSVLTNAKGLFIKLPSLTRYLSLGPEYYFIKFDSKIMVAFIVWLKEEG